MSIVRSLKGEWAAWVTSSWSPKSPSKDHWLTCRTILYFRTFQNKAKPNNCHNISSSLYTLLVKNSFWKLPPLSEWHVMRTYCASSFEGNILQYRLWWSTHSAKRNDQPSFALAKCEYHFINLKCGFQFTFFTLSAASSLAATPIYDPLSPPQAHGWLLAARVGWGYVLCRSQPHGRDVR